MPKESKETGKVEKAQIMRAFTFFDTDGSGSIERKEFQDLIADLGEVLTEEEVNAALSEIDTDGDAEISFDEFYTWWTKPDRSGGASEGRKAVQLKAKLKARNFIRKAKVLSKKINKDNVPKCATVGELSITQKIQAGDIEDGAPSNLCVEARLMEDGAAEQISIVKQKIGMEDSPAGLVWAVTCRPDADDADVEDLRSKLEMIAEMVTSAKPEDAPFTPKITIAVNTVDGEKVVEFGIGFELMEDFLEAAPMFIEIINSLIISSAWGKVQLTQSPGAENPPPLAVLMEDSLALDKGIFETARETLEMLEQKKKLRQQLGVHSLLKGFSSNMELEFAGPDQFLTWFKLNILQADEDPDMWDEMPEQMRLFHGATDKWLFLRNLLCEITLLLADTQNASDSDSDADEDEQLVLMRELLGAAGKCLQGIKGGVVYVGEKCARVTATNADVFMLVPTIEEAREYSEKLWARAAESVYLDGGGLDHEGVQYLPLEHTRDAEKKSKFWRLDIQESEASSISYLQAAFLVGDEDSFASAKPAAVYNPNGRSPEGKGVSNLLDGSDDNVWTDLNFKKNNFSSILVVEFAEPVRLHAFSLKLADDDDPDSAERCIIYAGDENYDPSAKFLLGGK